MNSKRYAYILYAITLVILATVAIQLYWNYKNYQSGKQQLVNDVQTSLDKAVDEYYTNLVQNRIVQLALNPNELKQTGLKNAKSEFQFFDLSGKLLQDSLTKSSKRKSIRLLNSTQTDSLIEKIKSAPENTISKWDAFSKDSFGLDTEPLKSFTTSVVIAMKDDSLDVKSLDSLVTIELQRKKIAIDYELHYDDSNIRPRFPNAFFEEKQSDSIKTPPKNINKDYKRSISSNSKLLPKGSILSLYFKNETFEILKRSYAGILLSALLVVGVISCLFYLLGIIKRQKQVAEVKNDLISNITHEFKTPIATIGVALESINSFNGIDDKEKTKKYLDMSALQLDKLNLMVEKLLETATLTSDNLALNKAPLDIVELLSKVSNRFQMQHPEKTITTHFETNSKRISVDAFHFENAITNILDNAIKYGGNAITVSFQSKEKQTLISVSDNGNGISKTHKDRIFEKFYRIPKGNTHDVKGFGIGLFYTKSIIEKHNGSITLDLSNNVTTFKIEIPNG